MANLTTLKNITRFGDSAVAAYRPTFFVKSGETIYAGSLVFVDNVTGFAYASTGATRVCVGYNDSGLDLTALSDTDTPITPRRAPVQLSNSGTSALANTDSGKLCYAEDNQTARLANSGSYAPLGTFIGIAPDGVGVVVEVGSTALATIASQSSLSGVPVLTSTASSLLSAEVNLGALTTGLLYGTVSAGTSTISSKGIGVDVQAYDADLQAIASNSTDGIYARTGAGTVSARTMTAADTSITVTNGDGVAGNPAFSSKFAPLEIADPGTGAAIPVTSSATVMFTVGAGAETNTLATPTFVGQTLRLVCGSIAGGTRAVTVASAINVAGNTVMTFNAARDNCTLVGVKYGSTLAWEIQFNASVALS
jgi:hypothetical protein